MTLILTYCTQIKSADKLNNFLVYIFSGATYLCAYILMDMESESDVFNIIYSACAIFFLASTLFVTLAIKPDALK